MGRRVRAAGQTVLASIRRYAHHHLSTGRVVLIAAIMMLLVAVSAVIAAVASGIDYYRRFNHVLTGRETPAPRSAVERDEIPDVHRVN